MGSAASNESVAAQENSVLNFERIELGNKQVIYHSFDDSTKIVSLDLAFKNSGYALDDFNKLGLTYLLLNIFRQAEIGKNPEQLRDIVEKYGIKLDFSAEAENFYISVKYIKDFQSQVISLLQNFLEAEIFSEKIAEQNKESLLKKYKNNLGNASFLGTINLLDELFADSDLRKNPYGTEETLANISLEDLEQFAKQRFTKAKLHMAISGNIDKKQAMELYGKLTRNLLDEYNLNFADYNLNYQPFDKQISLAKDQILIKAFIPAPGKGSNNFYKYYLANYLIGGAGLTSVLSQELREKHGLTYSVYSHFDSYNNFAIWYVEFATDKENYDKSLKILQKTLKDIAKKGFDEAEINEAKKFLTGSYSIYFNTNEKISSYLLDSSLRKISPAIIRSRNKLINSYTVAEINEVISKFVIPEQISYIAVGDF